jgi:Tfp pilus assembly protein PilW
MKTRKNLGRAGVSAIELLVGVGLMAVGALLVFAFVRDRLAIKSLTSTADLESEASNAVDFLVNDLHEAAPVSFNWGEIPQAPPAGVGTNYSRIRFSLLHYDAAHPDTPVSTAIEYAYQPVPGRGTGKLVRTLTDAAGTRQKVILDYMETPSAAVPLVYSDTSTYHMLNVSVVYHPAGSRQVRRLRRVALRG